jgi:hypothetical protein
MFTGNEELLEKGETAAEHKKHQLEEAERLEADKANTHPGTGGLFRGSFKELVGRPIFDSEDNVSRCPVCAWELEDDACIQCGYSFGGTVTGTETEENSEMTDYQDEIDDGFGDIDDDIPWNDNGPFEELPINFQQFYGHQGFHHHHHHAFYWHFSGIHDSDDEDDSDVEDDMDSFIDDGEGDDESGTDRSTVVGDLSTTTESELDTGSEMSSQGTRDIDGHMDEPDSQEGRGGEAPSVLPMVNRDRPTAGAGTSARHLSRNHRGHRNDRDDSANQPPCPNHRNGDNQQPLAGLPTQTIAIDDDSDDDAPIPPTRRDRGRRNRREQS